MKICGFQKLTLLDFPGRVACTVFTGGCNFLCPFCHNALLVTELSKTEEIQKNEVIAYLKKRAGILDGICVSGGEPLLQPDIEEFLSELKSLSLAVKLDTNGSFPEKLRSVVEKGLCDYVAMDIKNSKERYAETVGIENFDISPIEQSVEFLLSGKVDFEFRTTVVRELHTEEDIEKISKWISGAPRYFLQNFVDSGKIIGGKLSAHTHEKLESMRQNALKHIDFVELRGV